MKHTTSFGGMSPDVFREKVVRSETECIDECTFVRRTREVVVMEEREGMRD